MKNEDVNCVIKIIDDKKLLINEEGKIKIRGRTTSEAPKKPFRIKFSKKQQIFNFEGKEKKWNLLANYFDTSLLRNDVAFKISELMKYDFTPRCKPVDLILNGKFLGSYQLCDKIEVGENRVNITKMEKQDINEPEISGGYLIELDVYAKDHSVANYLETNKGLKIGVEYPEDDDITEEQRSYIFGKINQMENEVYNNNISSLDLYTYSRSFLANEFIGNPDHLWSNLYFTKERNDDKFIFGPLWDFDLSFDNDKRLYPTNNKTNFCFNYTDSCGTAIKFVETLLQNQNVKEEIKKVWEELSNNALNSTYLLNYIEERKKYIEESASLNYLRWYNDTKEIEYAEYMRFQTLEESVESLKEYIKGRVDSLTNLLNKKLG